MKKNISDIKNKTISGFFWRFSEGIVAQAMSFIISIVLARLLLPNEYGIVAITFVFLSILEVFATGGLGQALIQKRRLII